MFPSSSGFADTDTLTFTLGPKRGIRKSVTTRGNQYVRDKEDKRRPVECPNRTIKKYLPMFRGNLKSSNTRGQAQPTRLVVNCSPSEQLFELTATDRYQFLSFPAQYTCTLAVTCSPYSRVLQLMSDSS